MRSSNNINKSIQLCHKCNTVIPFGTPFISIVKSLEFRCEDEESENGEILEIIEAEEIMKLCKVCGSYLNTQGLETILKHLPAPGEESKN
jgi:hypothetical protein